MFKAFVLKCGAVFFRFRNFLFPSFIIMLFAFTRPALFLGRKDLDVFIVLVGLITALAGVFLRLFTIGFAYIQRGGRDGKVFADGLVTEGVYAHVRNPMYVANFLIIVGISLIYGSSWVYFLVIPFFVFVYLSIVAAEEDYLHKHFGPAYQEYCKKVNRFIPDFSGINMTMKRFSYDWKKAIRKDYGTAIGAMVGCYIIWLRKIYYFYDFGRHKHNLALVILTLAILACLYGLALYLKKSGRLSSIKP